MLRVHALYEYGADLRPHGSAYVRLLLPLGRLAESGAIAFSHGMSYERADVVIVERMWKPDMTSNWASYVVEQARRDGATLIYTIDDDLLDIERGGPVRFAPEKLMVVRYFAREADGIIVSTPGLKERFARLNERVVVVPNALDERLFAGAANPARRPRAGKRGLTLGYMGTFTHDADIMMVAQPLRRVLRKFAGDVELQLVGGTTSPAVLEIFSGLPIRVLAFDGHAEYPAFARWMAANLRWDLAIAPLDDNRFTRCKSDIKFLDYSILGIPGVYSRVASYAGTVRHLETGLLADNEPDAWAEALELALTDHGLRERLAAAAHQEVATSRTLEQRAQDWLRAIKRIRERSGNEALAKPPLHASRSPY